MKISRKDKYLLVLLGFVVVIAAYYFLLMSPQEEKIKTLESDLANKEATKNQIELVLKSESGLDLTIKELETSIASASSPYYKTITQEEMLATIANFSEGLPLTFTDMAFADNTSAQDGVVKYQATVGYTSDYDSVLSYIRKVRSNTHKIILKEVDVSNTIDQVLKGQMILEFNAIPAVAAYTQPEKKLITSKINTRDLFVSPFEPYESFSPDEVLLTDSTLIQNYPNYDIQPTEEIDYTIYRPKTQIYGFEDGNNFFVANNSDITGLVTRSKTKIVGGYSAELSFDFVTGRDYSEANVVFDTTAIMINKQADYLGLWVYAYEASNHAIGAIIIDSKGKEFKVELTKAVDWTQWQEIEAELPVEITYPCMIQRIYVEGIGYEQKLTGKYLFDQLEVSYPVQ